jgi:hypothetical protein
MTWLAGLAVVLGGCDFSFTNPNDPARCNPRCTGSEVCFNGSCRPRSGDAAFDVARTPDGPRSDTIVDGLVTADKAGPAEAARDLARDVPTADTALPDKAADLLAPDTGPQCATPGTGCCDPQGKFRPSSFRCDDVAVQSEYRCDGSGCGAAPQKRGQFKYCSGSGAACDTSNLTWEAWANIKTCGPNDLCTSDGTKADCTTCANGCSNGVCYGQCTPGQPCCTAQGTFQPSSLKCDAAAVATGTRCSGSGCGSSTQPISHFKFCTGTSAACDSSNLKWEDTGASTSCGASGICTGSQPSATCQSCPFGCGTAGCYPQCAPGQPCCTSTGTFQPSTLKCSTTANATGYRCASSGCNSSRQPISQYKYCSGTSAACDTSNLKWEDTGSASSCGTSGYCTGSQPSATCQSCTYGCNAGACYPQCTPGPECCNSNGTFAGTGKLCGSTRYEYQCSGSGCGAIRQRRTTQSRCNASAATCNGLYDAVIANWANYDCTGYGTTDMDRCTGSAPNATCSSCSSGQTCYGSGCVANCSLPLKSWSVTFCDSYGGGDGWDSSMWAKLYSGSTHYWSGCEAANCDCEIPVACGCVSGSSKAVTLTPSQLTTTQQLQVFGSGHSDFRSIKLTATNYFNHTFTLYYYGSGGWVSVSGGGTYNFGWTGTVNCN